MNKPTHNYTPLWKNAMLTLNDMSFLIVTPGKDVQRVRRVYDVIREMYPDNEIVFVYDSNTPIYLNKNDSNLIEVGTESRVYVSGGYNLALEHCTRKGFVFLHDDTFVAQNFLENMLPHITPTQFCNFTTVEPPLYNDPDTDKKPIRDFGRDATLFDQEKFNAFCKERIDKLGAVVTESPYGGFFMAGYKSSIDAVGGFDVGFRPYFYEDADLIFRMHTAGYAFVHVLNSMVYHMGSLTSRGTLESEASMQTTSRHFVKKWKASWEAVQKYTLRNDIPYQRIPAEIVATNSTPQLDEYLGLINEPDSDIKISLDARTLTPLGMEYLQSLPYVLQSIEDDGIYELETLTIRKGNV